jgi:hypothetical protein
MGEAHYTRDTRQALRETGQATIGYVDWPRGKTDPYRRARGRLYHAARLEHLPIIGWHVDGARRTVTVYVRHTSAALTPTDPSTFYSTHP